MDPQLKALMKFLKPFRDNNNLTDEEFVEKLAQSVLDHDADADPCFVNTFEDFSDIIRKTRSRVDELLIERHSRS